MQLRNANRGIILTLVIIGVLVAIGLSAFNAIRTSEEAKKLEEAASDVVETIDATNEKIDSTREIIEKVSP